MDILERYIAVDNKCAWPTLTLMPDGAIVATIFGEPCHGTWEGETECWRSMDGGRTWTFLSVPAPHEPRTLRGNSAAGLSHRGTLIVLCSGQSHRPPRGVVTPLSSGDRPLFLVPWACRSEDGGQTWTRTESPTSPAPPDQAIPFGDVVRLPGGRLAVTGYTCPSDGLPPNTAWVFFSDDDGRTWGDARPIGMDNYNETALLALGGERLLAASRTAKWEDEHLEIFASEDGGRTWTNRGLVSLPNQIPAHLCRLRDNSILLTYGMRHRGLFGVGARVSRDEGLTWDAPRVLFSTEARESNTNPGGVDGGYPSSVQTPDGVIVTAYYCSRLPVHHRYHMGVVLWRD
ncbi:MAG: exo-alpha-sialidase [Armatimonadetes bacterium]|nr:exo-alpha-sialidase [Armatimonadota bacterium]